MSEKKPQTVTVHVEKLKAALNGVGDVVEARNTVPILANVLIDVGNKRMAIHATDLDLSARRIIDVEDGTAFRTTVPAKLLKSIVGHVDADATMTMTVADGRITCTVGRSRFKLPTLPADDFPEFAEAAYDHQFEVDAIVLQAMIGGVDHAIGADETRYYLTGMYLHAAETGGAATQAEGGAADAPVLLTLRGVATDGHRLARYDVAQPDGAGALKGVIVPAKALGVIDALCDGFAGAVEIGINDRFARFDLGDTTLWCKLIDGTFPDYARVIPSAPPLTLGAVRATLIEAVQRVLLLNDAKDRPVKVSLAKDRLTLSVTSSENGEATEEVPVDWPHDDLQLGFNGKYLVATLKRIAGDDVRLRMTDPGAPVIVVDANPEAPGLQVLMPMRV